MQKKVIELKQVTYFKDEKDLFIDLTGIVEKEFERVIGDNHQVDYILNAKCKQLKIIVDDNIKFLVILSGCECLICETASTWNDWMREYGIEEEELHAIYASNKFLIDEPEAMQRTYKCKIEISIADDLEEQYYNSAKRILAKLELIIKWIDL